jgi:oligoribonuclease
MTDHSGLPTKLLWVDLEMTGLDPENDPILEVAAEITDFNFKTLASYEAIVAQPQELVVERMRKNIWWADYPENRDEFLKKIVTGKPSEQVEAELVDLISQNFGNEMAILAGNSIHNDRNFIKRWWPKVDLKLNYRMLDVSSWKVLMQGKYNVDYEKKKVHRAFDDIQASIAELQFYIEWFKNGSQDS